MVDLPTATPSSITAGDSISWLISRNDYLASAGYALTYALRNKSGQINFSASASGDKFLISLVAATTAAYQAGTYTYQAYITKTTDRFSVESGTIEILPNLSTTTTFDGRSFAKICLDNIEAVINDKATADNLQYTIHGRTLAKYSWSELLKVRGQFRAEVNREKRKTSGKGSNRVLVRF